MGGCVTKGPVKVVPNCGENRAKGSQVLAKSNSQLKSVKNGAKTAVTVCLNKGNEQAKRVSNPRPIVIPNSDIDTPTTNHFSFSQKKSFPITVSTGGPRPLKLGIAYDVQFHDDDHQVTPQNHPRRLKKLDGAPRLTAEMLRQKQEMAEKNRLQELQRKAETMSKRRRDVFKAREFGKLKEAETQMYTKLLATGINRQNQVNKIVTKQKEREERAMKVREKAGLNNNGDGDIIHVDETYNSESSCEDLTWDDDDLRTSGEECVEPNEDTDSLDKFFATDPC